MIFSVCIEFSVNILNWYMPFAIPGTNSADPQYQPDQYGCINPDIISTGPVIIKPGPVLPAPGPGPKPSDQDLKRELSPYEDISFGANQELENEKIFKLINTVKRQNLTLRKMRVELETQKRNYEKN